MSTSTIFNYLINNISDGEKKSKGQKPTHVNFFKFFRVWVYKFGTYPSPLKTTFWCSYDSSLAFCEWPPPLLSLRIHSTVFNREFLLLELISLDQRNFKRID